MFGETRPALTSYDDLISKGTFLFYREQERDAVEYLRSALLHQPTDLRARYLISLAAQLHSDEATIEQMSQEAQEVDPQSAYALACEAVRFMDYANFARADQCFEQALLKIPNDIHIWFGRGMLYDYSSQHEKAIGAYLRVVTLDPQNVSGHIYLGNAYADIGEYEAAYAEYQKAKQLDPETDNPHLRLGKDLFYGGAPESAIFEFEQAIVEETNCIAAYFFLLAAQRHLAKNDELLATYQEIRRRFPDQPECTAGLFEQFGAWQDAIREYRLLVHEDPDNPELHAQLAECHKRLGQWEDAASEYRTVLVLQPKNGAAHRELGALSFRLGRYDEAIVECRKAVTFDRLDFDAYTVLADSLVLLGKVQLAGEILRQRDRQQQLAWTTYQSKYYGGGSPARNA